LGDWRGGAYTTLGEEERARVRALPWFGAALARLESVRRRRAARYQALEVIADQEAPPRLPLLASEESEPPEEAAALSRSA
jgi:hypothetical protein